MKIEHSVKPCNIRNASVSTNMAKHAFLLTWSQRISQFTAEPLPADCLLKQEIKTHTCCLSCKPLATWAWSGCWKPHEVKSVTQSSPSSRFSLPLLTLNSPPRAGVSCGWWKKSEGWGGGALQIAKSNSTTNYSAPWVKIPSLLLVILVFRLRIKRPYDRKASH